MKRASYRAALYWLARNDDIGWMFAEGETGLPVSCALVADLFGVEAGKLRADLAREFAKATAEGMRP